MVQGERGRKGRAFPHCAAAKPLCLALLVMTLFIGGIASGQSKTQKASTSTDQVVTITLVRWPYT
jgi:hypothetical protein